MPNLVKNLRHNLNDVFKDKFLVTLIAIIAVVAINQIIFSTLLIDRNKAKAFTGDLFSRLITNLGALRYPSGSTGVLLAQFWVPDPLTRDPLTDPGAPVCTYRVDDPTHTYTNPCITLVDADGAASAGPGTGVDRDGPEFWFQFRNDRKLQETVLNSGLVVDQGICTDSESDPTCLYLDSDLNCDATDGAQTYILGTACGTASDIQVANIPITVPRTLGWLHVDLNANGLYDLGEDIYIMDLRSDVILQKGTYWNGAYENQWFGDSGGIVPSKGTSNAPGFVDADGDTVYKGTEVGGSDPIILDVDADGVYTAQGSFLAEADGGALAGSTSSTGSDDDSLPAGIVLRPLIKEDNICINMKPGASFIAYYDDSDFAADGLKDGVGANCIPGDSGTDVLINSTAGLTMAQIIVAYNATPNPLYPYTFISAAWLAGYSDANVDTKWTWCDPNTAPGCGSPETESLWIKGGDASLWHPNIAGRLEFENDGQASMTATVPDDDSFVYGLARGSTLLELQVSDNVCLGNQFIPFFGGVTIQIPEDIYVDGDGDCAPGTGGVDVPLYDAHGDGLVVGASWPFGGTWSSAVNFLSYYDHEVPGPDATTYNTYGAWDYCGNQALNTGCGCNPSGTLTFADDVACGGTVDGIWQPVEAVYDDVNSNGSWDSGEVLYWDPSSCATSLSAGTGVAFAVGSIPTFYNGVGSGDNGCAGTVGSVAQDQLWNGQESIWDDTDNNRVYNWGETILYDPSGCLALPAAGGYEGYPVVPGEKYTESLWLNSNVLNFNYAAGPDTDVYGVGYGLMSGDHVFFGDDNYNDYNRPVVGPYGNLPADCDGDSLSSGWQNVGGAGSCTNINQAWLPLTDLAGTEDLCTDSLTHPQVIYIDGNGDCVYGNGGTDRLLRSDPIPAKDEYNRDLRRVITANTSVGTIWKFYDHVGGVDGVYTCEATPGDCDDLYFGVDTGEPLPQIDFLTLIYMDADQDGNVSASDTILQDSGYLIGGPTTYPNQKLDRWDISDAGDYFSGVTLKLTGTATTADLANLRFCGDLWYFGNDGHCSPNISAEDGLCTGPGASINDPSDISGQTLKSTFTSVFFPIIFTGCIYGDIVGDPGKTINVQMPALVDANANGLYDAGDQGMFMYSTNDGPDALVTLPYGIVITQRNSVGGGAPSISAPLDIQLVAASSGTVTLTWQDPTDTSLLKVLIQRDDIQIAEVDKGVQTFVDTGLTPKQTYSYKLISQSSAGPVSASAVYTITIPETGTVITEPLPTPTEPGTPAQVNLPAGIKVGDLIKGATSSVYLVSSSGQRRVFPTEKIYDSWYDDFSLIKVVSNDVLSKLPLGPNVILRPGTNLMKINTDPKVYAVEPTGIIRWIETEAVAKELYGTAWNQRIIDVPDVFFVDYEKGSNIATANYSTGSLLQYQGDTTTYYIENLTKRVVSGDAFSQAKFRTEFVIKNVSATKFNYTDGTPFPVSYDFTMTMTQKNKDKVSNSLNSIFK